MVIAAVMAAIAATVVAFPLARHRQSRLAGALAGLLVIGAAAALYPLWSNWNWHPAPPPQASPEVLAMVARLEEHMREQPNNIQGWIMLGRSYLTLERFDDAIDAYSRALKLDGDNLEATVGLGEAIGMRAGGEITPQAAELFERAMTLAPHSPEALLYGGFAAAVRGNSALARSRWLELKSLHPPPQIEAMLDEKLAALGPVTGGEAAGPGSAPMGAAGGAAGGAADATSAQATINLGISPDLKSRLTGHPLVFVFAREPGAQGPPLAAKRLDTSAIGTQIQLSSNDSMMPGRVLRTGQRISITARVSFSGQPLPAAGDLYGELSYEVGRDGVRDLVIDHVAQ